MCLIAFTAAEAAEVGPSEADRCDYHLRGLIEQGDAEKLEALQINSAGITLCLDSPGGSLAEGKRLFDVIWDRDIAIAVLAGERCESACSLAFLAGSMRVGSWAVRMQARYLSVGGNLGFHSPSLELPDGRTYSSREVNTAFEVALRAAESFFEVKLTEQHGTKAMTDFLYQRILGTRPDSMFYIETVGDAVLANISLSGAELPKEITKQEIANICDNTYAANRMDGRPGFRSSVEYFQEIARGDLDDERRVEMETRDGETTGLVFSYPLLAINSAIRCSVAFSDDWLRSGEDFNVSFESYFVGEDRPAEPLESYWVPTWYVLPPSYRLVAMPETGDPFVRLGGYDLYGGDLPDGVMRNAAAGDCVAACEGRRGCDAVTHDRWNRICFLKSIEAGAGKLYVLSKADTYVRREKQAGVQPDRTSAVQIFTKENKAFSQQPDRSLQTWSVEACEYQCAGQDCLGFNWSPVTNACDMFKSPPVYNDAANVFAGFKVQPAQ